jgi:hypothetical protein
MTQNGIEYVIGCANVGNIPILSCPATPLSILSKLSCIDANGNPCQSQINWILNGPNGFIANGSTPANTPVNFAANQIDAAGLYTIQFTTICPGALDTCRCVGKWVQPTCDPCCNNLDIFLQNITNAFTVSIDNVNCKAKVNIGQLDTCYHFEWINWGDGNQTYGPFYTGNMSMHTYAGSGSYTISALAIALNSAGKICREKIITKMITLDCAIAVDTCECKPYTNTQFYNSNWAGITRNVQCGQTSTLPCLKPGVNPLFFFHGNLQCSSHGCLGDSVSWTIIQMPAGNTVANGTVAANPLNSSSPFAHFDINLNPAWFTAGTSYMMTSTSTCGSHTCSCKVTFSFESCDCGCTNFEHEVSQGFKTLGIVLGNCSRTLMPIALCPNDQVMWSINNGPTVATSIGNATVVLNFPTSAYYNVCMKVTRTVNGVVCGTITRCRTLKVFCNALPFDLSHCEKNTTVGNVMQNGDFQQGWDGELNHEGMMPNWEMFPNTGDGLVVADDISGANEEGHLILTGNNSNFAGVWQKVELPVSNFTVIEFNHRVYHLDALPEGTVLEFRMQKEPILGSPAQVLFTQSIDKIRCDWQFNSHSVAPIDQDKKYLVICLRNGSTNLISSIGLDNLEICASATVDAKEAIGMQQIRIVPNPNNGQFSIELPLAATKGMKFQIIDLIGKLLLEKQPEIGSENQTINAEMLPQGLYFLKLIADGKIIAVEKFVKQ